VADEVCVVRGYWEVNLELLIGNYISGIWEVIICNGRSCGCGHWILGCKCRIDNWINVTFGMAWYNLIWYMCVWSVDIGI
jgi:hypothetical protein